jgi:hypothetical protein
MDFTNKYICTFTIPIFKQIEYFIRKIMVLFVELTQMKFLQSVTHRPQEIYQPSVIQFILLPNKTINLHRCLYPSAFGKSKQSAETRFYQHNIIHEYPASPSF